MPRGLRQCWLSWSRTHSRRKSFSDALRSGRIKGILSRDGQQIKGKVRSFEPVLYFHHLRCFNDRAREITSRPERNPTPGFRQLTPRSRTFFFPHARRKISPRSDVRSFRRIRCGNEMGNGVSRNGICENSGNVFFTRMCAKVGDTLHTRRDTLDLRSGHVIFLSERDNSF